MIYIQNMGRQGVWNLGYSKTSQAPAFYEKDSMWQKTSISLKGSWVSCLSDVRLELYELR